MIRVFAVFYIVAVLFLGYSISAEAADCASLEAKAAQAMKEKQYRLPRTVEPTQYIEEEMLKNVRQWPLYFQDDNKDSTIRLFTNNWKEACKYY